MFDRYVDKIKQIQAVNSHVHVYVCPALPSKRAELNRKLIYFNRLLQSELLPSNFGVSYVNGFDEFCDRSGLLRRDLSRDINRYNKPDFLHLNWKGIAALGRIIRNNVLLRANGGIDRRKRPNSDGAHRQSHTRPSVGGVPGPMRYAAVLAATPVEEGYQST